MAIVLIGHFGGVSLKRSLISAWSRSDDLRQCDIAAAASARVRGLGTSRYALSVALTASQAAATSMRSDAKSSESMRNVALAHRVLSCRNA